MELRREFKNRTANFIKSNDKQALDRQLARHLSGLIQDLIPVGIYWGLPDEPHPYPFLPAGKSYGFPKVNGETLKFYLVRSKEELVDGPWGLTEPDPASAEAASLDAFQGLCVPGVVFDREGRRLGRGKGFYDRVLAGYAGKKIGVGYSVQVSDEPLPQEPHDVRMDWIVTEMGCIQPRGKH